MRRKVVLAALMMGLTLGAAGLVNMAVTAEPAAAVNELTKDACKSADAQQKAALGCSQNEEAPNVAQNLFNAVIAMVGLIAVFVIVIAGQRIATSNGDPGKLQQAKNMLLYGIIGVIVALLAFAIVNFVLSGVFSQS